MPNGATISASRRGRPTALQAQRKLENIIEVASELFCELGYRAVTMRMVAEKANVSPRTLYYQYTDKLSLFKACIDISPIEFPLLDPANRDIAMVLRNYASTLVRWLCSNTSLRLGMLMYRESNDFPELIKAGEANHTKNLLHPVSEYLRQKGFEKKNETAAAQLFISMAISEWQKRVSFQLPLPDEDEIERHSAFVVRIFIQGAKQSALKLSRYSYK